MMPDYTFVCLLLFRPCGVAVVCPAVWSQYGSPGSMYRPTLSYDRRIGISEIESAQSAACEIIYRLPSDRRRCKVSYLSVLVCLHRYVTIVD